MAVSGGADSMALALLAAGWAAAQGGSVVALIVDHGLRAGSADEAALTAQRLQAFGIQSEIIPLTGLAVGSRLAERARAARYAALAQWCGRAGVLHVLLGHHAADQAETVIMRMLAGSDADGLAGMAAMTMRNEVQLLRPLLGISPGDLRDYLRGRGAAWVEDPSNQDPRFQRARLRALRQDQDGRGPATRALGAAATARGKTRAEKAATIAGELAAKVSFHPEGYAVLSPGPIGVDALRALLRTIAGARYAPPRDQVAALAALPRPATIGGVRLLPAGRMGPTGALLLVRELAAIEGATAVPETIWDRRFRIGRAATPGDCRLSRLPAAIRHALPPLTPYVFAPPQPATSGLQPG